MLHAQNFRENNSGVFTNALTIDKAKNNTSLVFMLEWRGWRLLFPGIRRSAPRPDR